MLQISKAQLMAFNENLNHELIDYLELFLKHRYPIDIKEFSEADIHQRCARFVKQCIELGAGDKVEVLRLGEIVFKLEPDMDLSRLDAGFQECLNDKRFSFEERVDIITLRLAFPMPRH